MRKFLNKIASYVRKKRNENAQKKLAKQYEGANFATRERFKKYVRNKGANPSIILGKKVK